MKILVLTSEYPNSQSVFDTPVVHYYCKEWVSMGHTVKVIHYRSVFPRLFYTFANFFLGFTKKFFDTDFIPSVRLNSSEHTIRDGVEIVTRPIFKLIPHIRFSSKVLSKHVSLLVEENEAQHFIPDLIIGHFFNPQLELLNRLKFVYKDVKTSLVLHENPKVIDKLLGDESKKFLYSLDYLGFRFENMKSIFIDIYGMRENLFICPSGIPENYILKEVPAHRHTSKKLQIIFVGMLIPLKNVDILLKSLSLAFKPGAFELKIIGDGLLKSDLKALAQKLGIADDVFFLDKMPRDNVQEVLLGADIFVMVSEPEAFGLVYLEAMGKGCITIGTKGQGIDGVILDSENGFLCEARSVNSLTSVLNKIALMEPIDRLRISENALNTTKRYTDRIVAQNYLNTLNN